MKLTFRPLTDWGSALTPTSKRRSRSAFKAGYDATLGLLDAELRHLGASAVVVQVAVTEAACRLDGALRSDARPAHPGVRLVFDSRHGTLTYQTDLYTDWRHNLRAIALGLEALRAVDRYGITRSGQQYKGWLEIEAGPTVPLTAAEACRTLTRWSGVLVTPGESMQSLTARHREARAAAHPDRHGGDRTGWDEVEAAAKTLGVIS